MEVLSKFLPGTLNSITRKCMVLFVTVLILRALLLPSFPGFREIEWNNLVYILLPITTTPKSAHLFAFFPYKNHMLLPNLRLKHVSASAASTPTPSIQVDKSPLSVAPSKVLPFRISHGFDLHRLEPGYPLIIGGINISHERGCEAHSDGDVLLHCVVDAILGALGLPDIGQIFSDSDPKWKGCASSIFIQEST